eukprot:CAMPEP_0202890410 /NCGR_PEP_ID=MMETSP1392-20130828/817_1 /ASSEMBLY_ACC=CAM_ASM_000868 /TAXON_ID=225041 /ORGANISM="Chlamydomonas chlamydogama, Strain SAG 11-48b" /LENGTH=1114 /DNA_ID=CAMNT_0049573971 /DNA_START=250 /DNA_END=3594 /DNA_ORIENTATION=+
MAQEVKVEIKESNTDEVDFAKIPVNEAFSILQTSHHGLTAAEAQKRYDEYGPNKLPESTRNPLWVFLGYMWNPLAWAMEIAAIISIALLDYADFALIVALLLVNSVISYVEESNADKAIKALTAALAPKAKCLRDGKVETIEAVNLVPGDVIIMKFGDIVPADVKILGEEGGDTSEETPMQIDQAALTGESLPVKKFTGDVAFSGSAVKQGERHCVVYATGVNTFFGRAAALISGTNNVANLQIVMTKIGAMCLVTIAVWVLIELAVQFGHYDHSCGPGEEACPTLVNMLVVIVGGIPIAMPTVLSVTLALGAFKLAKEGAIVARMSAVEEMAGMDVLCSDKTGTLTLNQLSVEIASVMTVTPGVSVTEVMKMAALSTNIVTEEPIDMVLYNSYAERDELKNYKTVKFVPFNPVDKYTCATVVDQRTGKAVRLLKGSPQVVLGRAYNKDEIADAVNNKMIEFANRGFRSLGVARAEGEGNVADAKWEMLGLLPLFDPPRHDTKDTIERCQQQGIQVKMITGDHLLIGKETAKMLGMGTQMFPSEVLIKVKNGDKNELHGFANLEDMVEKCNGFAEVFPEHKFEIVKILQDIDHVVGMTGDGVNDAPALKKADVGIAVAGATDAARGAADIVLTEAGLSTIVTAVIGARKIFQRMTTYSKYTVAMTFRICFTFGLLTVIYDWYFPTILIVIMAVFNDGAMIALSKDKVTASPVPNSWNLTNIFIMGIVYGLYLTLSSWALYQTAVKTTFFEDHVKLFSLNDQHDRLMEWCGTRVDQTPQAQWAYANLPSVFKKNAYGTYGNFQELVSLCAEPTYREQMKAGDYLECPSYWFNVPSNQIPLQVAGVSEPWGRLPGTPTVLEQCNTEQKYTRGAMMRSLLYNHVSVSGQALVFVVRNQNWSVIEKAGGWTYVAFVLAQIGATLIALFGFGGYSEPRYAFDDCEYCSLSNDSKIPFWPNKTVPIALTESAFAASVIGCTGYVIVAWIWSGIWYVLLDPIKWILCYVLNEDGFRDNKAFLREKKRNLATHSRDQNKMDPNNMPGPQMAAPSYQNPLGRVSLSKPVAAVLDRQSASVVAITRNSATGVSRVSADPNKTLNIARRSLVKQEPGSKPPAATK